MRQLKKISINFEGFNLSSKFYERSESDSVLFVLHGFSGSFRDFLFLCNRDLPINIVFIDMIGHGESDSPNLLSFYKQEQIVIQLDKFIDYFNFKSKYLFGYSMGGRAALSYSVNFQNKINGLILESSTPGILSKKEANKRIFEDKELAEFILSNSIDKFVERWLSLPLFDSLKSLPHEKLSSHKSLKYLNNKIGLSNCLLGFGTGAMKNLWKEIETLNLPVLLFVGEYDDKFKKINIEANKLMPNSKLKVISNAKHIPHLENENEFIIEIKEFLTNLGAI